MQQKAGIILFGSGQPMTRTEEREQAFILIFEKEFNRDIPIEDIITYANEADVFEESDFSSLLAKSVCENLETIDAIIEEFSIGWKKSRLPKVTVSILRLAICEIMFVDSIPEGVSINEAVELAKKYATPQDASFINGILGKYSRSRTQ